MILNKKEKGFTLVELVITIVIVGILSIVGVNTYQNYVERARASEAVSLLRAFADALIHYHLETRTFTADLSLLNIQLPGESIKINDMIYNNGFYYSWLTWRDTFVPCAARAATTTKDNTYRYYIFYPNLDIVKGFDTKNKDLYKLEAYLLSDKEIDKNIVNLINSKGTL